MRLNRRRSLATLAATGVASGALAFGGVTLAEASSAQSPAVAAAAVTATPTATATPAPAPTGSGCAGGPGGLGGPGLRFGPPGAPQQVAKAVAAYLGLSQDQLRSQLAAGKSLADVATAHGKTVAGLKSAILTAGTSQINASAWLTAAQKASLVSWLKAHLDDIVNATFPDGPGGPWTGWPPAGGPGRGADWLPGM